MCSKSTPEERFWAKVRRSDNLFDCWIWTAALANGYGKFAPGSGHRPRLVVAHVYAYELLVGPVPEGLELDHLCRNPACVNPTHMEPVTHRENCLRGESPAARHARKTHCKRGHEFTPENIWYPPGKQHRFCRVCLKARLREAKRRRRVRLGLPLEPIPKTHCPHGHPYSPENTYLSRSNRRHCRTCQRERYWRDK